MAKAKNVAGVTWNYIPVTLRENQKLSEFFKHLIPICKPSWTKEKLEVRNIDEGLGHTNSLIGFGNVDSRDDIVLLRINGPSTELYIDRELEVVVMCLLNRANVSPPVYCEFANGLCYGYVPGRPLKQDELKDDVVLHQIMGSFAKFHTLRLSEGYCTKESIPVKLYDILFDLIPNHFDNDKKFRDVFVSKDRLRSEINGMKYLVKTLTSPFVLCHNDLQLGNIIRNVDKGSVTFIDFEYAGMNNSACDIGNFFSEYAGFDPPNFDLYPDEIEQKKIIRMYLEETEKLKGLPSVDPVSDEAVHTFYIDVNKGAIVMDFLWVIWCIVQSHIHRDAPAGTFDFIEYAILRYQHYQGLRSTFFIP